MTGFDDGFEGGAACGLAVGAPCLDDAAGLGLGISDLGFSARISGGSGASGSCTSNTVSPTVKVSPSWSGYSTVTKTLLTAVPVRLSMSMTKSVSLRTLSLQWVVETRRSESLMADSRPRPRTSGTLGTTSYRLPRSGPAMTSSFANMETLRRGRTRLNLPYGGAAGSRGGILCIIIRIAVTGVRHMPTRRQFLSAA